ncbi:hypothetical protein VTN02DRAFT_1174 [Thermoascus thermophilus]
MEEAGTPGVSGVAATGARPQGTLGRPEETKGPSQERPTARLGGRSGSVHSSAQRSVTSLRHAANGLGRGWNGRVVSCLQGGNGVCIRRFETMQRLETWGVNSFLWLCPCSSGWQRDGACLENSAAECFVPVSQPRASPLGAPPAAGGWRRLRIRRESLLLAPATMRRVGRATVAARVQKARRPRCASNGSQSENAASLSVPFGAATVASWCWCTPDGRPRCQNVGYDVDSIAGANLRLHFFITSSLPFIVVVVVRQRGISLVVGSILPSSLEIHHSLVIPF